MTDREKLKALLTEFDVEFEEEGNDVVCREGKRNIDGYGQFVTVFKFDAEGKFLIMGAWE